MKKGFVLLFSLLLFGLIISGTTRRNANSFAQNPIVEISPDDGGSEMKFDSIDKKALEAKDNDESAVRALADEVFGTPEFAVIPTEDREAIKERVINAELLYRSGGSKGIDEDNIVQTVNELADKFSAPDFARTSTLQVRFLRARLLNAYPNFIAQEINRGGTNELEVDSSSQGSYGDSVSPTMSPLEAVYVTGVMLWQKMLNKDYQYAPQEWVDAVYNQQLAQWQDDLAGNSSDEPLEEKLEYRLGGTSGDNEKRRQMMASVNLGTATLLSSETQGMSALTTLYGETLDTLGIESKEELR